MIDQQHFIQEKVMDHYKVLFFILFIMIPLFIINYSIDTFANTDNKIEEDDGSNNSWFKIEVYVKLF